MTTIENYSDEIMDVLTRAEILFRKMNRAIGHQVGQSTAYRQYGRGRVNRWAREGKIHPVKQGNRIYYDSYDLLKSSRENQL